MSADVELTDGMREVAARLLHLSAVRAEVDAEINELKAKLRSTLTVGQRGTIDGTPILSVTANRRFDPDYAAKNLPAGLLAMCMVSVLDRTRAKSVLPPALFESCMREVGEPVVRAL